MLFFVKVDYSAAPELAVADVRALAARLGDDSGATLLPAAPGAEYPQVLVAFQARTHAYAFLVEYYREAGMDEEKDKAWFESQIEVEA